MRWIRPSTEPGGKPEVMYVTTEAQGWVKEEVERVLHDYAVITSDHNVAEYRKDMVFLRENRKRCTRYAEMFIGSIIKLVAVAVLTLLVMGIGGYYNVP